MPDNPPLPPPPRAVRTAVAAKRTVKNTLHDPLFRPGVVFLLGYALAKLT